MTMHLIKGVQVHGNSSRKKSKLTDKQLKKLEVEWRQYNKRMRQNNAHNMQFQAFDDYVAYTRGEYKPKKKEFVDYAPSKPYVRNTKSYPSFKTSDSIPGSCAKPERKEYTGTLIKGIATMHKSNAVPVINQKEAEDIANMRRN